MNFKNIIELVLGSQKEMYRGDCFHKIFLRPMLSRHMINEENRQMRLSSRYFSAMTHPKCKGHATLNVQWRTAVKEVVLDNILLELAVYPSKI